VLKSVEYHLRVRGLVARQVLFAKIWIDFYSKRRGYILFDTLTKLKIDTNVVKILSSYPAKLWIYPSAITQKSGMPIEAVYQLLAELEREGLAESGYECRCNHCQKRIETVRRFNELPDSLVCKVCGHTMPTLENTVKIYQILYDLGAK